eukprot:1086883-Pleurochrysis_carterae.AAC.2
MEIKSFSLQEVIRHHASAPVAARAGFSARRQRPGARAASAAPSVSSLTCMQRRAHFGKACSASRIRRGKGGSQGSRLT